jgi:Cof subfamily protein (haloacid dehalogenase superfamily)
MPPDAPTPKMLVLDLDGTTLNHERQVSEVDLRAAERLQRAGITVTIATGRLFTGTQWVARALGVSGSVAVMNGSEVVDAGSGVTSHGRYVDALARATVREVVAALPLATFLFESRRIHYCERHESHARYLAIWTEDLSRHADVFEAPPWGASEEVVAVGLAGRGEDIERARCALAEALPPELEAIVFPTLSGEAFLKLRHSAEDKGTAMIRMAAERGVEASECVAVGDWYNDIPMLRTAGRSFAMAHARDDVRAVASDVLEASRDGGAIAEIARRVWGL